VTLVEDAVASGNEEAEKRLFVLLKGEGPASPWTRRDPTRPVSASARALAKYFPAATADRKVEIEIAHFGGLRDRGPWPSGAFDVGEALHDDAVRACGLCDEVKTNIDTSSWRSGGWTAIPRALGRLDRALVVTYVDADTIPPARYERWFGASIAELKEALDAGDGLVAVKERPNAPPLVTIAAPRIALLRAVEDKFAEMETLPLAPKRITLERALSHEEVQAGIRMRQAAYRACYEDLLHRKSDAAGTIEMAFTIRADGSLKDLTSKVDGTLDDSVFRACILDTTRTVRYPRWSNVPSHTTTVRYPLTFRH
jgi:hypothetical protein